MKERAGQSVRTCPLCGEAALAMTTEPVVVEFRDHSYAVDGFEYEACSACGETIHPAVQIDDIHRAAVSMARRDSGLLAPEEIRQMRSDLGLTQADLERILGVGPKSVTRWEKGTVFQSAVADNFMRFIREHPEIFAVDGERTSPPRGDRLDVERFASVDINGLGVGMVSDDFALAA